MIYRKTWVSAYGESEQVHRLAFAAVTPIDYGEIGKAQCSVLKTKKKLIAP